MTYRMLGKDGFRFNRETVPDIESSSSTAVLYVSGESLLFHVRSSKNTWQELAGRC
jgi:hypothetical protein